MSSPTTKNEALAETKEMDLSDTDITTQVENRGESEMSKFVVPQFKGAADILEEMKKITNKSISISTKFIITILLFTYF